MVFNSAEYLLFLPAVFLAFRLGPASWRIPLLLAASYFFYGWWDYRFLGLIVLSTVVDYLSARRIHAAKRAEVRKRWLAFTITANLGILGFFKYWGFFVESAGDLLATLGFPVDDVLLGIVLPVGISFYTFQTMSYTIDVYRGHLEAESRFLTFALFVSFFPQLVAGPIERATSLLPQIRGLTGRLGSVEWAPALTLIARGLFRKVVIADGIAPVVNEVFATPDRYGGITLLVGVIAFSLQIYGDFAGYSDIARGSARLFGVDLMQNFRAPYTASGFSDFWRRWHISLSTWLRDYLYVPLGGNRGTRLATARNLMITMLLGGLWHGAGWGFVVWGGLHGLYLVLERVVTRFFRTPPRLPSWLVFTVVTLTWVPFRSPDLSAAVSIWDGMLRPFDGVQLAFAPVSVAILGLLSILTDRAESSGRMVPLETRPGLVRGLGYGAAVLVAVLYWPLTATPFIYFQF
jgi:D-alanyl-lipoteichoic acid acyltransferase DltB (MBOAT superfamily)